jgi:hypothetical protein
MGGESNLSWPERQQLSEGDNWGGALRMKIKMDENVGQNSFSLPTSMP